MFEFTEQLVPLLMLATPLLLLSAGLLPSKWVNAHPQTMARLNGLTAWAAFGLAIGAGLLFALNPSVNTTLTLFSLPLHPELGAFSVGVYLNTVTVVMLLLVSFVGAVVSRYARNYLDGERNQGRFHKWLSLTLAAILALIISSNLLMFAAAWIATSLSLHQLLMFYPERRAALLAAHKKFVASRIGDVSLVTAVLLIGSTLHTLEFEAMFAQMAALEGPLPTGLLWASILIVVSAALKSAQFPLHGWLIQVMEAPTPVSALLHAGIVNAGAFLVIRMSPVISMSPEALTLLVIIGLTTLSLASLVMLTQTSLKVSLAWSTTAQMGFMLLEVGLGLYSLAMLHLLAHSLYKAHAFLASGSIVDGYRSPSMKFAGRGLNLGSTALALLSGVAITFLVASLFGITAHQQPAAIAAGVIVAIAVSQLILQTAGVSVAGMLPRALTLSVLVTSAYFALHAVFEWMFVGSYAPVREPAGLLQMSLAVLVIAVFLGLLVVQQLLKSAERSPHIERLYMHLYNGLYIDVYFTRLLQRFWPSPSALKATPSPSQLS